MKNPTLSLIGMAALLVQTASAQYVTNVLYTTALDFTNSTPNGGETVAFSTAFDGDNRIVNGLASDGSAGGAGVGGSLSITWSSGDFGQVAWLGSTPIWNVSYMSALMPGSTPAYQPPTYPGGTTVAASGILQMIYTIPDNQGGTYFQLGIDLAYPNDYYSQFFPTDVESLGAIGPLGEEAVRVTIPYTIKDGPADGLYGLGFAILINSDYHPLLPFYIDSIQILTPVPEPSTLALMGVGGLGFAFWARRRRS